MGHRWIITTIAQHVIDNPHRTVTIGELTRLGDGYTSSQVLAAMNKWRSRPEIRDRCDVIIHGRAWQWNDRATPAADTTPAAEPELKPVTAVATRATRPYKRRFEHVGQAADGALILRSGTGKLYTATEL